MNFFDFMRNTFVTNEPVWNYYGTEIYTDPVASPGRSAQFIQDYFLQGQKGDIVYELDGLGDFGISVRAWAPTPTSFVSNRSSLSD